MFFFPAIILDPLQQLVLRTGDGIDCATEPAHHESKMLLLSVNDKLDFLLFICISGIRTLPCVDLSQHTDGYKSCTEDGSSTRGLFAPAEDTLKIGFTRGLSSSCILLTKLLHLTSSLLTSVHLLFLHPAIPSSALILATSTWAPALSQKVSSRWQSLLQNLLIHYFEWVSARVNFQETFRKEGYFQLTKNAAPPCRVTWLRTQGAFRLFSTE